MTLIDQANDKPSRTTTTASGTPRILVVEDEETLSLLLAYNLESEGFAVECVERGDEADIRLLENPPDLVILGLDAAGRLRS